MPRKTGFWQKLKVLTKQPRFAKVYSLAAVGILFITVFIWSLLSAKIQQSNADQLVYPFLFHGSANLHGASIPGAHTFLIKWPLFWLIGLLGASPAVTIAYTILVSLVTVGLLAYIIHRIEKRPMVFATIILALASTLLLVPTMPYAASLLPDNLAMLTTRNLEYLAYIAALAAMIKAGDWRKRLFWLGLVLLGVVIASDKLFLALSVGGALMALIVYSLSSRWKLSQLSVNWLVSGFAAVVISALTIVLVSASHVAHITSKFSDSPYGVVQTGHNLFLAVVYSVLNLLTNFGANPAYDAISLRNLTHSFGSHILGLGGFSYIVNFIVLLFGLWAVWKIFASSLFSAKADKKESTPAYKLALALIWSAAAAFIAFIVSNHFSAVDARYLAITLFTVFICVAVVSTTKNWSPEQLLLASCVLVVSIGLGIATTTKHYYDDRAALSDTNTRNKQVVDVFNNYGDQAPVLVGNYWRVLPIKAASGYPINIMPLQDCTTPRGSLNTTAWQPDLKKTPFVYLLSFDKTVADDSPCSLKQIVDTYGKPNASNLIAGTYSHPKEELLFYSSGIHKSGPRLNPTTEKGPSTVIPITPEQLPYTSCDVPTSLNIVAHQDDDLLFMNPDIIHDIKNGYCVRTVFVTAGDDGAGKQYWLSREHGAEAAYSQMTGDSNIWIERIVELGNNEYVMVANPKGNSKVSLIFMRLPDGNLKGNGFPTSGFSSLQKLYDGRMASIRAVDNQSLYSSSDLQKAIAHLMFIYNPTDIRTQSNLLSKQFPDHSDHMAVGRFAKKGYDEYEKQQYADQVMIPLHYYVGYPVHSMAPNISDGDFTAKASAFFAYAKNDPSTCQNLAQCDKGSTFGFYLRRQYTSNN